MTQTAFTVPSAALADALADVVAYTEALDTLADVQTAPAPRIRQTDTPGDIFARAFDGGKVRWIDDIPVWIG